MPDRLAADLGDSSAVRAAVGHALAFETWRSLVRREGLTTKGAVDVTPTLVEGVMGENELVSEFDTARVYTRQAS